MHSDHHNGHFFAHVVSNRTAVVSQSPMITVISCQVALGAQFKLNTYR